VVGLPRRASRRKVLIALTPKDAPPQVIRSSFDALKAHNNCKDCQEMLDNRVKEVISQWVVVKRTI